MARKNHLCCLIKKVSEFHGGDDIEFIRQHCKEVLDAHPEEEIEKAINCYLEMSKHLK